MTLSPRRTPTNGQVYCGATIGAAATRAKSDAFAAQVGPRILALQQEGMSLKGIADNLQAAGIATLRGGTWRGTSVKNFARRWRRITTSG